jgi:D-sedoheptulose 7-phosphate isomerase
MLGAQEVAVQNFLSGYLAQSAAAAAALAADAAAQAVLLAMADCISTALGDGAKLLLAGNGGSASDAQHLAAEFVSRLMFDRAPLAALALTESGPILTACSNDYGPRTIFARQLQALCRPGDVFLALSTSGNSPNLLDALAAARQAGLTCLGFANRSGGEMANACDHILLAPSLQGQIVQQLHITAGHALLATVERTLFNEAQPV